jgi:peptide chain release factor 1
MLPIDKLEDLTARHRELEERLCQPDVVADTKRYTAMMKERADLDELVKAYVRYRDVERRLDEDRAAVADPELRDMVLEEIPGLEAEREELVRGIQLLLLPKDPNDERNTILEIRAGTGGEEAALFAADLLRMYTRFAEENRWKVEILSTSDASAGGLKEVIALVTGDKVYSRLRFEGGVHRVQRIPATESQGRIHTSTATVAVLPEAEDVDVHIEDKDLRIDTFRASGAGGQHVNRTDSAVRITHMPSGIVVQCQDERSQHKNKDKAMKVLRARLLEREQEAQHASIGAERRNMVGSGERSEKIRTYNYPQNRVTDHRIGLTLHKLDRIVEGDLAELVDALRAHQQAELLRQQGLDDHSLHPEG